MNNFCVGLNLPIPLFTQTFDLNSLKLKPHSKLDYNDCFSSQVLYLFDSLGLKIQLAECFYRKPYTPSQIHKDVNNCNDVVKINWVFGGSDSTMNWYQEVSNTQRVSTTAIGIGYRFYEPGDVKLLHKETIASPSLLQVGIPHNIKMNREDRLCISILPQYKEIEKFVTFNEGCKLFASYI